MKVYIIYEDLHGLIGIAKTRNVAIRYLLDKNWITEDTENEIGITIKELFNCPESNSWQESFTYRVTDEVLETFGFAIKEREVIE